MVRSFVFLLLLFVVFLTGMMLGISREQDIATSEFYDVEPIEAIEIIGRESFDFDHEHTVDDEVHPHLTQKTATLLETGVKGFYNVLVEVLYQISSLFI